MADHLYCICVFESKHSSSAPEELRKSLNIILKGGFKFFCIHHVLHPKLILKEVLNQEGEKKINHLLPLSSF